MARNPELEAILEARYDWEGAAPSQKAKLRDVYYELLDQLLARQASHGRRRSQDGLLLRGRFINTATYSYQDRKHRSVAVAARKAHLPSRDREKL